MRVCVPVMADGVVDPRWGRADRVAVAEITQGQITSWEEFDVGWDALHDAGPEGSHHARVVRFLREHGVEVVAAGHMGQGMVHIMDRMGIKVLLGAGGDARHAVMAAVG